MKSSKLNVNKNLKKVSILSLMVLSLSVGIAIGAEEFKLWHEATADTKVTPVEHMKLDTDKKDSVKWLLDEPTEVNVTKFVEKFSKEPFMFVEGMKEAIVQAKKEDKLEDLKNMISDEMFADKPDGFGIKTGAFKDEDAKKAFEKLSKALLGLEKIDENFLETLFKDKKLILAALNLTAVAPKASPSPSPSTSPSPSPSASPSTSPKPSTAPVQPPPVGEQFDDAALQRQAQQICDKMNAKNDEALKAIKDQLNPLKDALNDALNKLAEGQNQVANNNNKNKEKDLADVLTPLLANALNKDQQQDVRPATQQQQPFFPQQQNRRDNTDPQLNQPLPDQGQVTPPQNIPPYSPYGNNNSYGPVRLDLPSSIGSRQMADAEQSVRDITKAESMVKSATASASDPMVLQNPLLAGGLIRQLGEAKGELSNAVDMGESRLASAKKALTQLEDTLEEVKDGARALLPDSEKRKVSELERAVQEAKNQAQYAQQIQNMLPQEQRQMGDVMAAQQKVQQAEAALNQKKAEVDIALEAGNSKIAAMKKKAQNLSGVVSDLEGKVTSAQRKLGEVDQALTSVRASVLQSQMQPTQAGTSNVNRLSGFSGSNGGSRTQAPRLGGALQTLPTAARGGDVRGSLGAKSK